MVHCDVFVYPKLATPYKNDWIDFLIVCMYLLTLRVVFVGNVAGKGLQLVLAPQFTSIVPLKEQHDTVNLIFIEPLVDLLVVEMM